MLSALGICYVTHWSKFPSFTTSCVHLMLSVGLRESPSEQKNKANASLTHWKQKVPLAPLMHLSYLHHHWQGLTRKWESTVWGSWVWLGGVFPVFLCFGRVWGFKDGVVNTLISTERTHASLGSLRFSTSTLTIPASVPESLRTVQCATLYSPHLCSSRGWVWVCISFILI